jgi:hypothetical protein
MPNDVLAGKKAVNGIAYRHSRIRLGKTHLARHAKNDGTSRCDLQGFDGEEGRRAVGAAHGWFAGIVEVWAEAFGWPVMAHVRT